MQNNGASRVRRGNGRYIHQSLTATPQKNPCINRANQHHCMQFHLTCLLGETSMPGRKPCRKEDPVQREPKGAWSCGNHDSISWTFESIVATTYFEKRPLR